ncbi:fumarylacetoacetate hydrolase family protein [Georgenia sp. Z1344]|uniref:fumarylacetoacetate hydrolase family protein n=1 Tax=Georgenia sp. Z1344 TaxID=3416706 RepID=UPI003CF13D3B
MRIARFVTDGNPRYGVLDEDSAELVVLKSDPLFAGFDTTGERVPLDSARLLSPVIPRSKVIGLARSYRTDEMPDPEPVLFIKPNTSVIGPDDPVVLPRWSSEVWYEAELAVVIGRMGKDVPVERADEIIFGYTAANDYTAKDQLAPGTSWTRAKAWDTSTPIGPYLALDLEPDDLAVRARVDGGLTQDGRTSQLVSTVREIVAQVSEVFTLLPGDVVLTGTPAGNGIVTEGQRVEVEVDGIGSFTNPILRRD